MSLPAKIALGILAAVVAVCVYAEVSYDPYAIVWHDDTGKGRSQAQAEAELADVCHMTDRSPDADYCMSPRGWSVDTSHDGSSGPANAGRFFMLVGILPLSLLLGLAVWKGPRWLRIPAVGAAYVLGAFMVCGVTVATLASFG